MHQITLDRLDIDDCAALVYAALDIPVSLQHDPYVSASRWHHLYAQFSTRNISFVETAESVLDFISPSMYNSINLVECGYKHVVYSWDQGLIQVSKYQQHAILEITNQTEDLNFAIRVLVCAGKRDVAIVLEEWMDEAVLSTNQVLAYLYLKEAGYNHDANIIWDRAVRDEMPK